jgi:PEGA domain
MRTVLPILLLSLVAGCVEREMIVTTEPAGALVFVSDKEIGRSPVTQSFLWYGDYEIAVRHEGYRALHTHADLRAPIYEIPPLDLLSAIVPWTYHDRRYLHFILEPTPEPTEDANDAELIRRAEELRAKNLEPVEK